MGTILSPLGLTMSKTRYTPPVFARAHLFRGAVPAGLLGAIVAVTMAAWAAPGGSKTAVAGSAEESGFPPMPGQSAEPSTSGSAGPSRPRTDPANFSHAIVVVERHEKPAGVGVILAGDGRILTAFSPIGDEHADVALRYADGKLVHARVQDRDLGWDLALLVPETIGRADGLPASSRDPLQPGSGPLVVFATGKHQVTPTPVTLKGRRAFTGAGDVVLTEALELGSKVTSTQLGSPIVDAAGGVVGILGRGCIQAPEGAGPCTVTPFGAPVEAIRGFLRHALAKPPTPPAWLGVTGVADAVGVAKGVRIQVVRSESPADQAGLRGGEREGADLVVAIEGVPVTTPEALNEAIRGHAPGERITLLVYGGGKFRDVPVMLQTAPRLTATPTGSAPTESTEAGSPRAGSAKAGSTKAGSTPAGSAPQSVPEAPTH